MTFIQSLILAIVQGVTEFLPVSSSGHLNLFQYLFGLRPSLSFDIFLNTATLLSVIYFFRHQTKYFIDNLPYIVVGSIPAVIVGLLFKNQVESIFQDIGFLPYFFLITAGFLLVTRYLPPQDNRLTYPRALVIGIFQALAILPAISRSGSTIFAGLLLGLSPVTAFNFSFSLFIPASVGALLLDLGSISPSTFLNFSLLFSFLVTFLVGLISLKYLKSILNQNRLWYFSLYLFALSFLLILFR